MPVRQKEKEILNGSLQIKILVKNVIFKYLELILWIVIVKIVIVTTHVLATAVTVK